MSSRQRLAVEVNLGNAFMYNTQCKPPVTVW